jgi:Fur family peroxide stress response transcriptional regulator
MNQKHFRKRDAILTCLRETDIHPTAEWIFAKLKPEIPDLSIGTVYRNLALFKEKGMIISVGTVKGVERFDGNTEPHVHFVCTECGGVLDLGTISVPEELKREAATETGGQVGTCQLSFTGICEECLRNNSEETA